MYIKVLSQHIVNQIAAGEVVERPSSVIKELIENSIDAGASDIEIHIEDAGKSMIKVIDNGSGMNKESIELCVKSHATSKLSFDNLFDIHTFGFRGEAIPSIASISRLSIASSDNDNQLSWKLSLEGGDVLDFSPVNRKRGTTIEIKDLFFATPVRLKFLKTNAVESEKCQDVVKNFAMAFPNIAFKFIENGKEKFFYTKASDINQRISDVMGVNFSENTLYIKNSKDQLQLSGFIGVPTFNKSASSSQMFFVNNRFVKDKIFSIALKIAYSGVVPTGRYPVAVLFLQTPYDEVDVNVHPAKTEIRFKDADTIKNFIVSSIKKNLLSGGAAISATAHVNTLINSFKNATVKYEDKLQHDENKTNTLQGDAFQTTASDLYALRDDSKPVYYAGSNSQFFDDGKAQQITQASFIKNTLEDKLGVSANIIPAQYEKAFDCVKKNADNERPELVSEIKNPFGTAIAQINNKYIIAQIEEGIMIVDQHAVAERIALEKIKRNIKLSAQALLLPEICNITSVHMELLKQNMNILENIGFYFEILATDLILIKCIPAILETCDAKKLFLDVLEDLEESSSTTNIEEKINYIFSTIACHNSLRAGKKLSIDKMNALLREMENTANIAQCCHGRPSYMRLSEEKINTLFERSGHCCKKHV